MEHAANGLQKVVLDALRRAPAEELPVIAWPFVCGPRVASRTRVLDFVDGILRIEVPDAAWRVQLLDFASEYLRALNELAPQRVTSINFVLPREWNAHHSPPV